MSLSRNIPSEIASALDRSLHRVRVILFLRGFCVTVFVAAMTMLLHMAVLVLLGDEMPTSVGWVVWIISLASVLASAVVFIVLPMRRRFTAAEIASLIERNHPELEERLSTVVELAEAGELDAHSSLLEAITRDAVRDAGTVSPKREFTPRTVWPRLIALIAVLAVFALSFAIFPRETGLLFIKAVNPSAEIANVYAGSMDISPKGDQVVMSGTPFTITMRETSGHASKAYVISRRSGEKDVSERMSLESRENGATTFGFVFPAVDTDFTYRIKCGRAISDPQSVRVVPRPDFSDRRIEIVHPAYTHRPPDVNDRDGTIVGLPGSTVNVSVRPSRPGLSGRLEFSADRPAVPAVAEGGRMTFSFDLTPECAGSWEIRLWDANGFTNVCDAASISLTKDAPPTVRLTMPESLDVSLPPSGELPLGWEITEDFGLARTVLEMCRGAGEWEEVCELTSDPVDGITWKGGKLEPFIDKDFSSIGAVLFRVKAVDELPAENGGPGIGYSPEITVKLVKGLSSLARQNLASEIREAKAAGESIEQSLQKAKNCATRCSQLYRVSKPGWEQEEARRQLGWAKGEMANAERLFVEFLTGLEESRLAKGVEIFRPVLDTRLVPARQKVEDVFLMARQEARSTAAASAAEAIQKTIDDLQTARRRFDALTKQASDLQRLEEYAERERALAELAEKGAIDDNTFAELEERLENQFKEEFKNEFAKNLNWQSEQARKLEDWAEKLANRQEDLRQRAEAAADASEAERQAMAKEERKIAESARNLANEAAELKRNVENTTGPFQDDPKQTAEPLAEARENGRTAADEAKQAADKLASGDLKAAQEDMSDVKAALDAARQQLEDARGRMGEKNADLAAEGQEFKEMAQALHEAAEAAREAAREAAKAQQQSGEQQAQQQQGDQQQAQQQSGEQQSQQQAQPSQAQQAAREAARQAAQKMQGKAERMAEASELPFDQFQQDARESQDAQPQRGPSSARRDPPGMRGVLEEADGDVDWFKMKGNVRSEAEIDRLDDVPQEYRGLVRDYFNALKKGGK